MNVCMSEAVVFASYSKAASDPKYEIAELALCLGCGVSAGGELKESRTV